MAQKIKTYARNIIIVSLCVMVGYLGGCVSPKLHDASEEITGDNTVIVRTMSLEIPEFKELDILFNKEQWDEYVKTERFMWDNFITTNANHFRETHFFLTEKWEARWESFGQSLVKKAKAQDLDGESLEKSLSVVTTRFGNRAHLPLSATFVEDPKTGKKYWAIFAVWEMASSLMDPEFGKDYFISLGHVCAWLIDVETFKIIAEVSCG